MFRSSRLSTLSRLARNRGMLSGLVVMAAFLTSRTVLAGDQPGPSVVVPACPVTLEAALPLAADAKVDASANLQLVEVDHPDVTVPVQLVPALSPEGLTHESAKRIAALIPPREGAQGPRRFALQPAPGEQASRDAPFRLDDISDKSLGLWDGDAPVLVYNHGMITAEHVPEKDPRRTRGCYIHPVYGLSGEVLTDDFPRDHFHHHGVFWTWPHVKVGDREYDLWADRGIQQRFVRWLAKEGGPVAGTIGVENGWFVGDAKVMIERVWIRAYKPSGGSRSLDLEFTWIPVDEPITLWGAGGKSYGGLTVRFAPPSSNDPNTVITVPSGRTTGDLPDTPLAWADFTSIFGGGAAPSGAAVFVPPSHPDYPPTWLTRHYGPLCVGWPGVEPKAFEPGKPIRLEYRLWIHGTALETTDIQQAYDAYAAADAASASQLAQAGASIMP